MGRLVFARIWCDERAALFASGSLLCAGGSVSQKAVPSRHAPAPYGAGADRSGEEPTDLGQETTDLGQEPTVLGQKRTDLGQHWSDRGQECTALGYTLSALGSEPTSSGRKPKDRGQADPVYRSPV